MFPLHFSLGPEEMQSVARILKKKMKPFGLPEMYRGDVLILMHLAHHPKGWNTDPSKHDLAKIMLGFPDNSEMALHGQNVVLKNLNIFFHKSMGWRNSSEIIDITKELTSDRMLCIVGSPYHFGSDIVFGDLTNTALTVKERQKITADVIRAILYVIARHFEGPAFESMIIRFYKEGSKKMAKKFEKEKEFIQSLFKGAILHPVNQDKGVLTFSVIGVNHADSATHVPKPVAWLLGKYK
jgi:hypothetical protein